ncbi:type IV toxin-antitoxin system AbiEi family antitoxin domain-containing protein [Gordonia defluvii]|jgi:hypothetical protein
MTTIPIDADGAVRRRSMVARGLPVTMLYRAVAAGDLDRIGSGLYVPAGAQSPDARHRLMIGEVKTSLRVVVSHASAAVLHGLPMLRPEFGDVHVTVPSESVRVRSEFRRIHVAILYPGDVVDLGGQCATSLERTAVDVAAASPMGFAGALAVFDAALRRGAHPGVLADLVRRRGATGTVRLALRHSSPCADGVGESWCRAQLLAARLPRPRLKHPLLDVCGEVLAEPDMDWDGSILGEFDGAARFGRVRVPGDSPLSAAWRAIARDDRLGRMGIRVLRFTWTDLERRDVALPCRYWLRRVGLLG